MQHTCASAKGMLTTMCINATQSRLNEMNLIPTLRARGGRVTGRQCCMVAEIAEHSLTGAKLVWYQHVADNAPWWQSSWRLCPLAKGRNAVKQQKNEEALSFYCLVDNVWECAVFRICVFSAPLIGNSKALISLDVYERIHIKIQITYSF